MSASFVVLLAVVVVLAFGYARHVSNKWDATLQQAAGQLGLTFTKGGLLSRSSAVGDYGGLPVTIDTFTRGSGKNSKLYTRVRAQPSRFPASELRREGIGSSLKKAFVGEDIVTGDRVFDDTVVLRGHETTLLSRLDAPTRGLVTEALSVGVRLAGGQLQWDKRGYVDSPQLLVEAAERLVELSVALGGSAHPPAWEGLRTIAFEDPVQEVRDAALGRLLDEFPQRQEAREAAALVDGRFAAEVRLAAASLLGQQGLPILVELSRRNRGPSSARAKAMRLLAEHHPNAKETAEALLEPVGFKDDPALAVALRLTHELGIEVPLARLLDQVDHAYTQGRAAVAARLGDYDVDRAREALVSWLERDEEDEVLVAAIESLGRSGGREEVAPLLPYTKGLLTDGDVKRAARAAVESIQERLGAAGAGRLSIAAAPDLGGLALAKEAGGLSLENDTEVEQAGGAEVAEASERN